MIISRIKSWGKKFAHSIKITRILEQALYILTISQSLDIIKYMIKAKMD